MVLLIQPCKEFSFLHTQRLVNRVPVSVQEPMSISFNCISILIPAPTEIRMSSVHYIKYGMPKACFTIRRVRRLWLRHTALRKKLRVYGLWYEEAGTHL